MSFRISGATHARSRPTGQALAEFAIVLPLLIALLGGIIQFGLIFWAQNTLTQVVRDTGRWAATQENCSLYNATSNPSGVDIAKEANLVASNASLLGYSSSTNWTATDETTAGFATSVSTESTSYGSAGDTAIQNNFTTSSDPEGVAVAWVDDSDPGNEGCPPTDNQSVYHVTIRINHAVPIFMPGMQYLPGLGTCTSSGCNIVLSSTAQFRMEPAP